MSSFGKNLIIPETFMFVIERLNNSIHWISDVFAFADRTAAGPGETLSFFKNISAPHAFRRADNQFFPMGFY